MEDLIIFWNKDITDLPVKIWEINKPGYRFWLTPHKSVEFVVLWIYPWLFEFQAIRESQWAHKIVFVPLWHPIYQICKLFHHLLRLKLNYYHMTFWPLTIDLSDPIWPLDDILPLAISHTPVQTFLAEGNNTNWEILCYEYMILIC